MTPHLILALLLFAGLASAQLQLLRVGGPGVESPVAAQLDMGTVPSGDFVDTKLRIRNTSDVDVALQRLRVLGVGFSLRGHPSTPVLVKAGLNVDFRVRFQPTNFGTFSANLQINDITLILLGTSPASVTLSVEEDGATRLLSSGDTIFFGQVERKRSRSLRFLLSNPAATTLTVSELSISEGPFRSDNLPATPIQLAGGMEVGFTVIYEPETSGAHEVVLTMEGRSFVLIGAGLDPPFPIPEILFETTTYESGQQGTVSVRLAEPPSASGQGELRMDFLPAIDIATDDPAVQFLATGTRTVPLSFSEGTTHVLLGGADEAVFQTGTTAGAIRFTVLLGRHSKQASVMIPRAAVVIDSTRGQRTATGVEVEVVGFDNTLSASKIRFRFLDTRGDVLTPEPITAEVAKSFRAYFESAGMGGMFSLRAQFPVAGDASQIGSVEVQFTNLTGDGGKKLVNF